jgi:hypothetical protein
LGCSVDNNENSGSKKKAENFVALISGFRRDVDEICGLLLNYTASCDKQLPHDAV